MNSLESFFKKERIPLLVFISIFIIWRLPFFLNGFLSDVGYDTWVYSEDALAYRLGNLPNYSILPPLYSFFLFLAGIFKSNNFIVLIQIILTGLAPAFLIFIASKFLKLREVWAVAIACIIYYSSSYELRHETILTTEWLYTCLHALFAGALLLSFFREKFSVFLFLGFVVSLIVLSRSNGLYILPIYFIISVYLYFKNKNFSLSLAMWSPVFLTLLLWASVNLYQSNIFLPFNANRIMFVLTKDTKYYKKAENGDYIAIAEKAPSKKQRFFDYFLQPSAEEPSFYHSFLKERYKAKIETKWCESLSENAFKLPIEDELRVYTCKEYLHVEPLKYKSGKFFELESAGIIMKSYHLSYVLYQLLVRNMLVLIFIHVSFFYFLLQLIKSRPKVSSIPFFTFILFLSYYFNLMLVLLGHVRNQWRYISVLELYLYIGAAFFVSYLINKLQLYVKK